MRGNYHAKGVFLMNKMLGIWSGEKKKRKTKKEKTKISLVSREESKKIRYL